MRNESVDFQRADNLSVLLKYWYDGDEEEGIMRPLSTLTPQEKKNICGMNDRCSRHKSIAQECERLGKKKRR